MEIVGSSSQLRISYKEPCGAIWQGDVVVGGGSAGGRVAMVESGSGAADSIVESTFELE